MKEKIKESLALSKIPIKCKIYLNLIGKGIIRLCFDGLNFINTHSENTYSDRLTFTTFT